MTYVLKHAPEVFQSTEDINMMIDSFRCKLHTKMLSRRYVLVSAIMMYTAGLLVAILSTLVRSFIMARCTGVNRLKKIGSFQRWAIIWKFR